MKVVFASRDLFQQVFCHTHEAAFCWNVRFVREISRSQNSISSGLTNYFLDNYYIVIIFSHITNISSEKSNMFINMYIYDAFSISINIDFVSNNLILIIETTCYNARYIDIEDWARLIKQDNKILLWMYFAIRHLHLLGLISSFYHWFLMLSRT